MWCFMPVLPAWEQSPAGGLLERELQGRLLQELYSQLFQEPEDPEMPQLPYERRTRSDQ